MSNNLALLLIRKGQKVVGPRFFFFFFFNFTLVLMHKTEISSNRPSSSEAGLCASQHRAASPRTERQMYQRLGLGRLLSVS